jgi:tetratricopeptide (TPR) repeat protein
MNKNRKQKTDFQKTDFVLCPLSSIFCFLFSVFCLLLFGCGSMPPALSDAHMNAIEFNHRADRAFKNSDYKKAGILYNEALKVNRSIENIDGIALNLINLAAVYRKTGDKEIANRCVDEILNSSIPFSQHHLSEAAYIKAIIYMDDGHHNSSQTWLDKALSFCKNAECSIEGRIYNLKSRISLLNGNTDYAVTYAYKALEMNKKNDDRQEAANSLRLIADAKTSAGEYDDAKRLYEDALDIDKSLGLSKKIVRDLMGIGNALMKQGRHKDACMYFKRAISANKNHGDENGFADVKPEIEKCLQDEKRK